MAGSVNVPDDNTIPSPSAEWHHWAYHPTHGTLTWRTEGLTHRPTHKEVINQHWEHIPSKWDSGYALYDPDQDQFFLHSRRGDVPEDVSKTFKKWYPKMDAQIVDYGALYNYPEGERYASTKVADMPKLHDGERVMVEPLGIMATVVRVVPSPEADQGFAGMDFGDKEFSLDNRWYYEIAYTQEDGWPSDGTTTWAEHALTPVPTSVPSEWGIDRTAAAKEEFARLLEEKRAGQEPEPVGHEGREHTDDHGKHDHFAWNCDPEEGEGGLDLTNLRWSKHEPRVAEADHSGAMIALYIPADKAKLLAVDDGEPAEDLHVTLAYFADAAADRDDWEVARRVAAEVAREHPSLSGEVSGFGEFRNDDGPVHWVGLDAPGLVELVVDLREKLAGAGFEINDDHGFQPHITVAYGDTDLDNVDDKIGTKLDFDCIYSVVNDEKEEHPLDASNRVGADDNLHEWRSR